jgi:ribose 5-phosphate isomerase B
MRIAVGSDHAGFEMKEKILDHLRKKTYDVVDAGTDSPAKASSYVEYGRKTARIVASGQADLGIVICGTGIGISLAANKISGIRCANCMNEFMAGLARRHNDANMLALGARLLAPQFALAIVDAYLDAAFEGGRHAERVDELNAD